MATKTASAQHQFLVVVNSGPDADYTTEPRHRVELDLPFNPSGRSSAQQLREVCSRVRWEISDFLPQSSTGNSAVHEDFYDGFHVWLCDESGQPTLFVTGLLAVREGRATEAEVEAQNRLLFPQVACEQEVREYQIYLSTAVHTWAGYDEPVGNEDELYERENELLDELEGVFDWYSLGDSDEDDDGSLYLSAEGCKVVTVPLPFQPGPKTTAAQLRYASVVALAQIQNALPGDWEMYEDFGDDVWVLDNENEPVVYVTGLLDVWEGRLSPRKLKTETERAKRHVSWVMRLAKQAA